MYRHDGGRCFVVDVNESAGRTVARAATTAAQKAKLNDNIIRLTV